MLDTKRSGPKTQPKPARIGYARVSTEDQSLHAEDDELRAAGCIEVYSEHASGKKDDRPELANALRSLRPGDTLVVCRLDRLGRSLAHLIDTVAELGKRGVNFESLADRIDTSTAGGELIFHIFASIAQFERRLISERTKAALAAGRARGRQGGRVAIMNDDAIRRAKGLLEDRKLSVREVARMFGVGRSTLYANLKRLQSTGGASQ